MKEPGSGRVFVSNAIHQYTVEVDPGYNHESPKNYYSNRASVLFCWRVESEVTVLFRG